MCLYIYKIISPSFCLSVCLSISLCLCVCKCLVVYILYVFQSFLAKQDRLAIHVIFPERKKEKEKCKKINISCLRDGEWRASGKHDTATPTPNVSTVSQSAKIFELSFLSRLQYLSIFPSKREMFCTNYYLNQIYIVWKTTWNLDFSKANEKSIIIFFFF